MKKARFSAICFLAAFSALTSAESRRYIETIGNSSGERIVSIESDATSGMVTIDSSGVGSGERDVVVTDAKGSAVSWTNVRASGEKRVFSRMGDGIEIIADGTSRPAKGVLDAAPWFASMDFGLARFVADGGESTSFWIVNPKNGKAYKMDARRAKTEHLSVGGKEERAVRVEVTAHGVPAFFYSMDYWFRESDALFLRFSGTQGGPGSPKYTIEFAGEN
jgi:hypothetical protein